MPVESDFRKILNGQLEYLHSDANAPNVYFLNKEHISDKIRSHIPLFTSFAVGGFHKPLARRLHESNQNGM